MNFARLKKHVVSARMTAGNQLITNQQNKKSPSHKGHWNANSIKMQRARVQEVRAVHRAIWYAEHFEKYNIQFESAEIITELLGSQFYNMYFQRTGLGYTILQGATYLSFFMGLLIR